MMFEEVMIQQRVMMIEEVAKKWRRSGDSAKGAVISVNILKISGRVGGGGGGGAAAPPMMLKQVIIQQRVMMIEEVMIQQRVR